MVLSGVPRKKSPVTPPGIDPGTVRLVAHRMKVTLHKAQYAQLNTSCSLVIRIRNVSDEFVKKKTLILRSVTFFPPENLAVYEIMLEKYFKAGQATDYDMAHAHCMLDT